MRKLNKLLVRLYNATEYRPMHPIASIAMKRVTIYKLSFEKTKSSEERLPNYAPTYIDVAFFNPQI